MPPKNHVPVTVPTGTSTRLQPNKLALQMPHYVSAAIWLMQYPLSVASN